MGDLKVRCSECKRMRPSATALSVSRYAGGSYRRPHRWYDTTICLECGEQALAYRASVIADNRAPGTSTGTGISYRSIEHALERLREAAAKRAATADGQEA